MLSQKVVKALMRVAGMLDEHKKLDRSESIYREILEIRRRIWGQGHELTGIATIALGNNLRKQDKLEEAERLTGVHHSILFLFKLDALKQLQQLSLHILCDSICFCSKSQTVCGPIEIIQHLTDGLHAWSVR